MASDLVKITILVDNRAGEGLLAEHGLSLWIEADGKRILLDAGQGGSLEFNARLLGVDPREADFLVLSHGHYDHTGGIPHILPHSGSTETYCHPGIVRPRYSIRDGKAKSNGIPREALKALETSPSERLHWVRQPVLLSERIGLTGPIPRATDYEDTGGPFFLDPEGKEADPIEDDLALWIRTDEGIVVLAGCSHAGIMNTLGRVRCIADNQRIRAVIGGLHLTEASPQRLDRTIAALVVLQPDDLVLCHCTGDKSVAAFKEALGERVSLGAAGMTFRFGS